MRDKLVAIGLLAADRVATEKTLAEHLIDFVAALNAKGNIVFHVETVTGRGHERVRMTLLSWRPAWRFRVAGRGLQ
jgi:hypothetical protein